MRDSADETDFSAQQPAPAQDPWVPRTHEQPFRSPDPEEETRQGTQEVDGKWVSNQGFSGQERLHKRKEYLEAFSGGDKVEASCFVVYLRANDLQRHRLGITVSRKIGKSVVRNRVKRRVREIFRQNKELCPVACDIVVNARKSAARASYRQLESSYIDAVDRWKRKKEKG
jgi:ribonuclease P protein component